MKKNYHLTIFVETEFVEKLKKQAEDEQITLSELCRKRLRNNKIDKIEFMLSQIYQKVYGTKFKNSVADDNASEGLIHKHNIARR